MLFFRIAIPILLIVFFSTNIITSLATDPAASNRQNFRGTNDQVLFSSTHHHVTTRPAPTAAPEYKRSDRCLVHNLAEYNNVTTECFLVAEHGTAQNKTYTYELTLGTERYQNTSIGKQKACQALAEEALRQTKYSHPQLRRRTCAIIQSPVSLVQEWAQKRNLSASYEIIDQKLETKREYTIECNLGLGFVTHGIGEDKKTAKTAAAENMWDKIQDMNLPVVIGAKSIDQYNTTEAMYTHPVSRIYEIQRARHGLEPVFNVINRNSVPVANRQNVHIVHLEGKLDNLRVVGQGRNIRQAKADAAEKLLKEMGFLVAAN